MRRFRKLVLVLVVVIALLMIDGGVSPALDAAPRAARADDALVQALRRLVRGPGGPPGVFVVVQRGKELNSFTAGVSEVGTTRRIRLDDHMRLASVAKAFSGAAALALVTQRRLRLDDTVVKWLPDLPRSWSRVTLRQLLGHTSGIPDFSKEAAFRKALTANPFSPPSPRGLLRLIEHPQLEFTPGSRYKYSNSDNIIIALMIEAASNRSYGSALRRLVYAPIGLHATSLPRSQVIPSPFVHGYQLAPPEPPEDVSGLFAAGWAWASGGVVSTPRDDNSFFRAYVSGQITNAATRRQQFHFVPGNSEPPGPGTNSAGLAIFRYATRCGTVYGHTGNTAGYTQFAAANGRGTRSVTVSVNAQITPASDPIAFAALRHVFELGTCAALAR